MTNFLRAAAAERTLTLPGGTLTRPLSLLDVGARGGVQWPWSRMAPASLDVVMIEPDPVEAERLLAVCRRDGRGTVIPAALWRDERKLPLRVNRSPGTSSVFEANKALVAQFPDAQRYETERLVEVTTQTIDKLAATGVMPGIDFAKIDVQGAELAILEGGMRHLSRNLVGLELEVEFCELYSGQPLFGDIDAAARSLGLELWDLRKTYWKYDRGRRMPGPSKGRLIFGDALYLRPLQRLEGWLSAMPQTAAREKATMLVVSAVAYGYLDYAVALLEEPLLADYFERDTVGRLQQAIRSVGAGFRPFRRGNRYLHMIFDVMACAFKPTHEDWASSGHGLGSRRRGPFWC